MEVTKELVHHVANLCKLSFTDEEIPAITEKFESIIQMMNDMDEVDTSDVTPMTWGTANHNVMRPDEVAWQMDREELLANTKTKRDGFIEVPTVIDESEDNA